MNLAEIKNISIKNYLASIGCKIEADRGYYGMYCAPYRNDTLPSLKVDYSKNIWIDFSTDKGGSILDLVMTLEKCDFKSALDKLRNNQSVIASFSFHRHKNIVLQEKFKIKKIDSLKNKALLEYLKSRNIEISIAQKYCEEIYSSIGEKEYFAIAFRNDFNTFELRNKYFKGCIGAKNITTIKRDSENLLVFEGFIDMLSFATYYGDEIMSKNSIVVLNSLSNLEKAEMEFSSYTRVYLYLDNDESGTKSTDRILQKYKNAFDKRNLYFGCKDLNDYLMNTTIKTTPLAVDE